MRVELLEGGRRPWPVRAGLELARAALGVYPGPPLALSYRPDLFHSELFAYILHSMRGAQGWDKGHGELFAAFVSRLNSCRF